MSLPVISSSWASPASWASRAASIWNTGLIGMAVAFGRYEVALVMALINFVTLRYVQRFKDETSVGDG